MRKSLLTKTLTTTAAIVLAATTFTTAAFADTKNSSESINGSIISGGINPGTIEQSVDHPLSLTLTGKDNAASDNAAVWNINGITDATGSGLGWTYEISVSSISSVEHGILEGAEIILASDPTITRNAEAPSSTNPEDLKIAGLENQSLSLGNVKIFEAEAKDTETEAEGMGTYDATLNVKLKGVKANAYAGDYKTEVTVTMNSNATSIQ